MFAFTRSRIRWHRRRSGLRGRRNREAKSQLVGSRTISILLHFNVPVPSLLGLASLDGSLCESGVDVSLIG